MLRSARASAAGRAHRNRFGGRTPADPPRARVAARVRAASRRRNGRCRCAPSDCPAPRAAWTLATRLKRPVLPLLRRETEFIFRDIVSRLRARPAEMALPSPPISQAARLPLAAADRRAASRDPRAFAAPPESASIRPACPATTAAPPSPPLLKPANVSSRRPGLLFLLAVTFVTTIRQERTNLVFEKLIASRESIGTSAENTAGPDMRPSTSAKQRERGSRNLIRSAGKVHQA